MKNKELEELLNKLKDNNDWYVIENKEEHNTEPYKLLLPTERNLLLSYIEQLENNRDKVINILCEVDSNIMKRNYAKVNQIINKAKNILKGDGNE